MVKRRFGGVLGLIGLTKTVKMYEQYSYEVPDFGHLIAPGYCARYYGNDVLDTIHPSSIKSNCRNCGAPVAYRRCDYCGTHY